jgi:hypothetical protein
MLARQQKNIKESMDFISTLEGNSLFLCVVIGNNHWEFFETK